MDASLTWSAMLVDGVPAPPGEVPFAVVASYDPIGEPPSYPPDHEGPPAMWSPVYQQLTVTGTIEIVGEVREVLSAGQAVDAMLSDTEFLNWLATQPSSAWSVVNVFLQNPGMGQGIVPAGPSWEIDVFREIDVPRNWAIGFVDAYSGRLLNVEYCNDPCDR
jgi:hypothetical protein